MGRNPVSIRCLWIWIGRLQIVSSIATARFAEYSYNLRDDFQLRTVLIVHGSWKVSVHRIAHDAIDAISTTLHGNYTAVLFHLGVSKAR